MEDEIQIVCDKCGELMPIDKTKGTKRWVDYKKKCKCGGKQTISIDNILKNYECKEGYFTGAKKNKEKVL